MALKFGEYLVDKKIINSTQVEEALSMQKDNPELKMGELLVAQGAITKEDMLDYIHSYMQDTGAAVEEVTEWLSQSEADALILKLKSGKEA